MKQIRQFGIILAVTFAGEILKNVLPLPIPASIYGLLLMLLFLRCKVIPLESISRTGKFFIEIMPLMFIPAAVGIIDSMDQLLPDLVEISVITAATTVIVMAVTGVVTQHIIEGGK